MIAVLRREPEADLFLRIIVDAERCELSSVTLLETSMVLAGRSGNETAWAELDAFVRRARMIVVPQDERLVEGARSAFLLFGKGRHPAGLNMGDCASYALAKARGAALLFKGDDFSRTDLAAAI